MKTEKQPCLFCRDSGYVVWQDDGCALSSYCDCAAGDAAYHRDQDVAGDEPTKPYALKDD